MKADKGKTMSIGTSDRPLIRFPIAGCTGRLVHIVSRDN